MRQDATNDKADVPFLSDFQLRLLYVAGLPRELRAYVTADKQHRWYQEVMEESVEDF